MKNVAKQGVLLTTALLLLSVSTLALAQGGVNDGTGGLNDLGTWVGTIMPIIGGIAISVLALLWGFSWIHGPWIPKALGGIFASSVASYAVGLFL